MNITSEHTFETAIVQSLTESGGYTEGEAKGYSPDLGMFKNEVLAFLQPVSGLNPDTLMLYKKNRLCVVRQVIRPTQMAAKQCICAKKSS